MRRELRLITAALAFVLTLGTAGALLAQTTAADFYMTYRKALAGAKKVEDLMPFVSEKTKKQMQSTPADQREMMFGLMKIMSDMSDVKVTKEARTATGVTLTVEGVDTDKNRMTGTITLVTENGGLKIDRESWSNH